MSDFVKTALTRLGGYVSQRTTARLDSVVDHLEVGRWLRSRGFRPETQVGRREELWELIGQRVRDRRVLFIEFGVSFGESIRYWSNLLKHPDSRLDGFDTFEGLPEAWRFGKPKGRFSTGGVVPQMDDPRVRFFRGLFEDTLPEYRPPAYEQLIIHLDADLYSSTIFPLCFLRPLMIPGTYLIFDEFNDRHHELKAFDEFLQEVPMHFRLVASNKTLIHAAFERIA